MYQADFRAEDPIKKKVSCFVGKKVKKRPGDFPRQKKIKDFYWFLGFKNYTFHVFNFN